MDHLVSYHQSCPVCGRNLHIGVTLLGKRVYCQHCGGAFVATEAADRPEATRGLRPGQPSLEVVDALIERAEAVLGKSDAPAAAPVEHRRN